MANPWASAYPMRPAGAPASGVVQSDQEFQQDWASLIASTPTTIRDRVQLDPNGAGYEQSKASDYWSSLQPIPFGQPVGGVYNAQMDRTPSPSGPHFDNIKHKIEPGTFFGEYNERLNPLYAQALADREAAESQRGENQIRQQQAFDTTMMGNGAIGGVMPSDYSSPTYGQVTGQKQGGLGGLGGSDLSGVDMAQQSGDYRGGAGAYNPSPWGTGSFNGKSPWTGF